MYAAYFGLSEPPFSISPNPRYLYMSKRHREAMAHLLYGIQQAGGFVVLTGEVGTGKTTLCRCLLSQIPDTVDVAMLLNPNLDETELLAAICDELKIDYPPGCTPKQLLARLNDHLLTRFAEGRHTVIIVDEAQLLSGAVLEQIRLLTNLETTSQKLLQIILIAQPELSATLQRSDLRQLSQRVTARYHLTTLTSNETSEYIRYRLEVAGCKRPLFSGGAVRHIHRRSGGVPRLINVICDRALMGAYSKDMSVVSAHIARSAADEVLGADEGAPAVRKWVWIPVAASVAAAVLLTPVGDRVRDWAGVFSSFGTRTAVAVDTKSGPAKAPAADARLPDAVDPSESVADAAHTEVAASTPPESYRLDQTEASETAASNKLGMLRAMEPLDRLETDTDGISELLREYGVLGGRLEAFQRLTELWGLSAELRDESRVCADIERMQLRCFRGRGTWNNLRKHNRAAILVLRVPQGTPYYAVVSAMSEAQITLDFAHERVQLPITDVDPYWYGEYWILWRPLPSGGERLSFRDEGPDVLWLRRALKRAQSSEAEVPELDQGTALFDTDLLHSVIAYQKRNDLTANGVVGVETLLRLNSALEAGTLPLLVAAPRG